MGELDYEQAQDIVTEIVEGRYRIVRLDRSIRSTGPPTLAFLRRMAARSRIRPSGRRRLGHSSKHGYFRGVPPSEHTRRDHRTGPCRSKTQRLTAIRGCVSTDHDSGLISFSSNHFTLPTLR